MVDTVQGPVRSVWRRAVPNHPGRPTLVPQVAMDPTGILVAVTTAARADTFVAGSTTVFDVRTGAIAKEVQDEWAIVGLAFSADGRWLATSGATGADTNVVRVVDAAGLTERCRHTETHNNPVTQLAFSADGLTVFAQTLPLPFEDPVAFAMDAQTGRELWRLQPAPIFSKLAVSPDAGSVAFGLGVRTISLRDAATGRERRAIATPSTVYRLAFTPEGRGVFAGCEDGFIRRYDPENGELVWSAQLDGNRPVSSLSVSRDGRWVAAVRGTVNGAPEDAERLGVFDTLDGTPRFGAVTLRGAGQLRFSPTGQRLIGGWDCVLPPEGGRGLSVVDPATGAEQLASDAVPVSFAIAADGAYVAIAGAGFAELFDLGVALSRFEVGVRIAALRMSPVGTPLVAIADGGGEVHVVAAASGTKLGGEPIPGGVTDLDFARNAQAIVAGGTGGVLLFNILGGTAGEWKLPASQIGTVNAVTALGPAGESIAVAAGSTLRLVNSADGRDRWAPATHPQTVTRVAASSDGTWLATGCRDRIVRVFDAMTGAPVFTFETRNGTVEAVAFQPGQSVVAAGNADGTVILVDAASASVIARVERSFGCAQLAFSFEEAMLAVAWDDGTVTIHDVSVGGGATLLREIRLTALVSALGFHPSGTSVYIATDEPAITVLDPRTGLTLAPILHPQPAGEFAFSGDGTVVATACDDAVVRVWASQAAGRIGA